MTLPHVPFPVDSFPFEFFLYLLVSVLFVVSEPYHDPKDRVNYFVDQTGPHKRERNSFDHVGFVMSIAKKVQISNYCNFTSMYRQ